MLPGHERPGRRSDDAFGVAIDTLPASGSAITVKLGKDLDMSQPARSDSVLAHLADRFVAQRENLATAALAYVLNNSPAARRGLSNLVLALGQQLEITSARDQVGISGDAEESGGIGDLGGYDPDGNLVLILEAKFDAGFTKRQPVAYLREVGSEGAVVVIAPERRVSLLWDTLKERASALGTVSEGTSGAGLHAAGIEGAALLGIVSWRVLLAYLHAAAIGDDPNAKGDLDQLAGFCEAFERDSFTPVRPEELTSDLARRVVDFSRLVDSLASRLIKLRRDAFNKRALRKASALGWHGHYMHMHEWAVLLHFSAFKWGRDGTTPIWLSVRDRRWKTSRAVEQALRPLWGTVNEPVLVDGQWQVPLRLPVGEEREEVLASLQAQVEHIAALVASYQEAHPEDAGVAEGPPPGELEPVADDDLDET